MPEDPLSVRAAVAWAATNYAVVVKRRLSGRIDYDWGEAENKEPNSLARAYMVHAATNPTAFFGQLVPKFLGDEKDKAGVTDEEVEREKKSIAEIRKLLKRFTEER